MATSSVPRHHPEYRKDLPGGLAARWSSPKDDAGIALTGAIAFYGTPEGGEAIHAVSTTRSMHSEAYFYGSTRWAICVGTTGPRAFPRKAPEPVNDRASAFEKAQAATLAAEEHPLIASIRAEASQAPEPVLALVAYNLVEWKVRGHPVKVVKHIIVACRPACRASGGGVVMKELFAMCHNRALHDGAAFSNVMGIPNYYRLHGFEHGIRLGPFYETHASHAPAPSGHKTYTSRDGTPEDAEAVHRFADAGADTSPLHIAVGPSKLLPEIEWEFGHRPPPFDADPSGTHLSAPPLVLERDGKIVAGVALIVWPVPGAPIEKIIAVQRVWYDKDVNLPELAKELVPRVYEHAQRYCWGEREKVAGGEEATRAPTLKTLSWRLSPDHPLGRMMHRLGLAIPATVPPFYDILGDQYIKIHLLALFCKSLEPVFNDRLTSAADVLGPSYTGDVRISTYSSSVPGCTISVKAGKVASIEPHKFSGAQIMAFHPGRPKLDSPNVIGPEPALVKLLMGFASLEQVRAFVPNFSVLPEAVPLLEVLFPLCRPVTHMYL